MLAMPVPDAAAQSQTAAIQRARKTAASDDEDWHLSLVCCGRAVGMMDHGSAELRGVTSVIGCFAVIASCR